MVLKLGAGFNLAISFRKKTNAAKLFILTIAMTILGGGMKWLSTIAGCTRTYSHSASLTLSYYRFRTKHGKATISRTPYVYGDCVVHIPTDSDTTVRCI